MLSRLPYSGALAAGLQFQVAYTYSKLMNNGAETGLGSGGPPVQNPSDMRDLYSVSSDDVPHILSLGWVYKLPFGKGKPIAGSASGFVDKIIGGWQISGIQSYSSGRPLSITMSNDMGSYLFNYAKFPNKTGSGLSGHFSNPRTDSYLNPAGWADPGALLSVTRLGRMPTFAVLSTSTRTSRSLRTPTSARKNTFVSMLMRATPSTGSSTVPSVRLGEAAALEPPAANATSQGEFS